MMPHTAEKLYKELTGVLKKYKVEEYNPEIVVEILSRSLRRKKGSKGEYIRDDSLSPSQILREQRKRSGLSLTELSQKAHIPKSNLSAMENNKRTIGVKTAKMLARILWVNYRVFL